MTSNHKLTGVLQGRTITGTQNAGTTLTLSFDDASVMTVQTAPSGSNQAVTGKVVKVRQQGTQLDLDLDGGVTFAITTAEETSSVIVRDKNHVLEYAD